MLVQIQGTREAGAMALRRRFAHVTLSRWPAWLVVALTLSASSGWAADLDLGRRVYEKANCVGCHKWHGGGGGGYGGAALSLRETALDHEMLVEVIRCGRPATRMPYHDRGAYQAADCYGGTTKADLGADFPPKAATFLRDPEIEAVADYVIARQQGKGEPTYDDCVAFWGANSQECAAMK
jgi:mono/diheme cytochrome c family protein